MKLEELMLDMLCAARGYLLTKPLYSGIGTILAFHRVCPRSKSSRISANSRLEVTPEYLEDAIRFLAKRNYEIISPDQLLPILHSGKIDKKFAIFTFDDGYADILTYAYPIFKKYNVPFTIYVTTNFPNGKAAIWWNLLEDLILKNSRLCIEADEKMIDFDCRSIDKKEAAFNEISSVIKNDSRNDYQARIEKIFNAYNVDIYQETAKLALSWGQVKQLAQDPLATIGSHGVNHWPLSNLSDSDVRYEIVESKREIESQISRAVEHFCYPFGTEEEMGARECRLVKEYGFKTAATSRKGNVFLGHRNYKQCLPRAIISGEREGKNIQYLNLWINGLVGCARNRFRRIATFPSAS